MDFISSRTPTDDFIAIYAADFFGRLRNSLSEYKGITRSLICRTTEAVKYSIIEIEIIGQVAKYVIFLQDNCILARTLRDGDRTDSVDNEFIGVFPTHRWKMDRYDPEIVEQQLLRSIVADFNE